MVRIGLLISVMRTYKIGAKEAMWWLFNDHDKATIFTSGEVYIPTSWNK